MILLEGLLAIASVVIFILGLTNQFGQHSALACIFAIALFIWSLCGFMITKDDYF